ncbi:C39 family peptidase [Aerococcaceae bacterium zg-ZUI334]|uniref:C39 family peptidase n=1 Tax=Aerococcaceae bacterium zg-252 TaxID=2796928 RepID=UPI001B9D4B6F|nr:C39 family peptidase [Aerococcaceae bacterium zg-ZUI334]
MQRKMRQSMTILTLSVILFGLISINALRAESEHKMQSDTIESTTKIAESIVQETTTVAEIPNNFANILNHSTLYDTTLVDKISTFIKDNYDNSHLQAQNDILKAINTANMDIEESGFLFLPKHPAKETDTINKQLDIPLLLQKDVKWRTTSYGTNTTNQLGENGCAIVSLAMVDSYYKNKIIEPQEIIKWSGNDYYLHNQGTSWQIFYDFAMEHGYYFENFGSDFYAAMQAVQDGKVIIASVSPGHFTEVGHILIIRGYDGEKVYVNDPNDNAQKMFSLQGIDSSIFLNEGLNYWAIYR